MCTREGTHIFQFFSFSSPAKQKEMAINTAFLFSFICCACVRRCAVRRGASTFLFCFHQGLASYTGQSEIACIKDFTLYFFFSQLPTPFSE